jgi:diguanylate cyclase (GGDEF)-like protein
MSMKTNILVIEDSKTTRQQIIQTLKEAKLGDQFFEAENGLVALKILTKQKVDLIFCDVIMPQMDGFKFLMAMQGKEESQETPILFMSVKGELNKKLKVLELGAWDFLPKPFENVELIARTKVLLRIKSLQDRLKSRIRVLEKLSIVDGLTGLYNKKYLFELLRREIQRSERYGLAISCLMMDVDHFKEVNDNYGHQNGDLVLKEIGVVLTEVVRGYDFSARFGGDEFTVVLPQQKTNNGTRSVAERIRAAVENHTFLDGHRTLRGGIKITMSVGAATFPGKGIDNHEDLVNRADEALYGAKKKGRNCVVISS